MIRSVHHRAQDRHAAGCPIDVRHELLGHEKKTIAAGYGVGQPVGQRTYVPAPQPFLGAPTGSHGQAAEITTREIDVAVRDLLEEGFVRAKNILTTRRADLDAGAQLLLKRETITADDFPAIRSAKAAAEPQLPLVPAAS